MLSLNNRTKLNNDNPTNQEIKLGTALTYVNTIIRVNVNSDASTAFTFTMPVAMNIADVIVQAQATKTNGALQLKRGATAITDAIACATDHTFDRAATIDNAQAATTAGETLTIVATGDAASTTFGFVYIYGSPI